MLKFKDLTPEQHEAVNRLYETDETLLVGGVGLGKAIIGLTAVQELIQDNVLDRVLVLAPLRVAQLTWGSEPSKWEHITEEVALALGTPAQRAAAVESGARIVVCNFENLAWMLKHYGTTFDGVLIDEMSKLKTAGGATVKALRRWTKTLKWRVGMSATPVAESGTDIYAQAVLLDLGKALGRLKTGFLRQYFYPTDYEQRNWEPLPGSEEKIAERLKDLVFMADDADYKASLPPVIEHLVPVRMPLQAHAHYTEMQAWGEVDIGGIEVVAVNEAVTTGKLQQIAAGGLYANESEERSLVWKDDFKHRALLSLLADLDGPVILVYQYLFELERLQKEFPNAPVLGAGGTFTLKDQARWNAGEIPILLGHPKSFSHGLNLQHGGNHLIYLSPLWSADGWIQTLGRLRRRGSPFSQIHRWILAAENTVESRMMQRLREKALNEKVLMNALENIT